MNVTEAVFGDKVVEFKGAKVGQSINLVHPVTKKPAKLKLVISGGTSNPFNGYTPESVLRSEAKEGLQVQLQIFDKVYANLCNAIKYNKKGSDMRNAINDWNNFIIYNFRDKYALREEFEINLETMRKLAD